MVSRVASALALLLLAAPPLRAQCPDGTPPPCRGAARAPAVPTSVAVLYFDNLSRDTADIYLAEGLTEQTIAQLGEVSRLSVTSRYAVRRFRGAAAQSPAEMGRVLNVSYLVTGSVQRAGGRLRVGVELLRASSGVRVWGDQYDRTDTDLLRIQDDIAASVATGIIGRLLPAERRAVTARTTHDAVAYDHFLRGNFYLAQRNPQATQRALREYQAAIQADPAFTDAVARSAYVYANALDNEYDIGLLRDTMVARGLALSERALRLDSTSSDAWLASAYVAMGRYPQTAEGVRERFERAIALDPRSAEAHHQYASFLQYMGDTVGAVRENRQALALEPGRAITWFALADLAVQVGRPRDALPLIDSCLAADPGFVAIQLVRFNTGLTLRDTALMRSSARALTAWQEGRAIGGLLDAFTTAFATRDSAAIRPLQELVRAAPPPPATAPGTAIAGGFFAMMLVTLGDNENALIVLDRVRPRGFRMHELLRYPGFDGLRQDPRFIRLFAETRAPGSAW